MKRIEITVSPQGETRLETKDFEGSGCREASHFIELALGHQTAEQLTGEFFATGLASQANQQRS